MILEISPHPLPPYPPPLGVSKISYAMTETIETFLIKRPYHLHIIGHLVVDSPRLQGCLKIQMHILKLRPSWHCKSSLIFTKGRVTFSFVWALLLSVSLLLERIPLLVFSPSQCCTHPNTNAGPYCNCAN